MILSLRAVAVVLFAWWGFAAAYAHDPGLSAVEVVVHPDAIELTASYALADVQKMLPPSVRLGTDTSKSTIDAAQAELEQLASLLWEVRVDGQVLPARDVTIGFTPSDTLAFRYAFMRPGVGLVIFHAANLGSLPSSHHELFTLLDGKGRVRATHTLSALENSMSVALAEIDSEPIAPVQNHPMEPAISVGTAAIDFFKLGVEHIWTGYDHLLFLCGLLLVCRGFRSVVIIITCFTLAHSLTLGLATLNLVSLPSWLVEPLIAASIVFVGLENIFRRGAEPPHRGWLSFGFGLIHGFGFASVLRDLGVGVHSGGIALPLFSFNLGVEVGQVCVAAVVLAILARTFRSVKIRERSVAVISSAVAAAGFYWLIQRTLLN